MLRRFPLAFVLVLGAFLAGCGLQDVRVDGTVEIGGLTVVYDGTAQQPEITMDPPGAWIGASITVAPDGGSPLPAGTWPVDAGVYQVVAEAGPSVEGGRAEGTLTIAPRPVPIAPEAGQGKLVGQADPVAFAYEATNLVGGDTLVGALARAPGESVGTYAFEVGTLSGGPNYALALVDEAPSFAIAVSVLDDGAITVASDTVVYDGTARSVVVVYDPPAASSGALVAYGDLPAGELPVDAGVYAVSVTAGPGYAGTGSGTLTIEPRPLTLSGFGASGKTYDGTFAVPVDASFDDDRLAGDDLTFAFDVAFASVDAGAAVAVEFTNVAISGGADAGNYELVTTAGSTTAAIAARPLVLSDFMAEAKVFDGTTDVVGADFTDDRLEGDVFSVGFDAVFASADVGDAVSVAFSDFALSGAAAGNYALVTTSGSAAADITPRSVTVAPEAGQGKSFGQGDPAFVYTASNLVGGDVLVGALARAPGELVDTYAFVVVPEAGAPNYVLELGSDAPMFTISESVLGDGAITVSSDTVVYDGSAQSVVVGFDPPAAGTGAVVTYGDLPAGELPVEAGVYAVSVAAGPGYAGTGSGTLTIDPRSLTLSGFSASGKTYDRTAAVPVGASFDDDRLAGDELTFAFDVAFASVDAGAAVAVSFTNIAISGGADAGNYVLATTSDSTTAAIAARPLALAGFAVDAKVYDGTTVAFGGRFTDDRLDGDAFSIDFDAAFAAADVGDAVSVAFSNFALSGADAGNYALATTSGSAAADITPRPLSLVGASAADKVYDGTLSAMVTGVLEVGSVVDRGLLERDLDDVGFGGAFLSSGVGVDVPVDVALSGSRASNYALDDPMLAASITPRALSVVVDDQERVYGVANPSPTYTLSGFANSEDASSAGVSGTPDLSTSAELESLPGDYGIVVDGVGSLAAANYGFSIADVMDGTLTIVKRPVSFDIANRGASLTDAPLAYDSKPLAIVVEIVDDQGQRVDPVPAIAPIAYDVLAPRYRIDATGQVLDPAPSRAAITDAGMYWVTIRAAFGVDDPRYDVATASNVEVFVERRALSVGAQEIDKVYGATDPSFAPLVLDGMPLAVNDAFTAGTLGRSAGESVGTYDLVTGDLGITSTDILRGPGRSTIDNYDLSFGAFEITPAPLTVAATPQEKVYGDALADGAGYTAFTPTGLQFADAIESVTVAYAEGSAATAPVGPYEGAIGLSAATGSAFAATNYAITYAPGDLEVTPAPLTVTAIDQGKVYGDVLESGAGYAAFTASGLRNEETIDSVTVAYVGGEAGTDPVDTYVEAIVPSAATGGTFTASNYAITYGPGDLEVTLRALAITATNQTKEYARTLEAGPGYTGFITSGLQNGETVGSVTVGYTDGAESGDEADTLGAIQLSAATGGTFAAANYDIAYADGSLTVVQRPISFDVANYDVLVDGVRVFLRDGLSPIGYSISSNPEGVTAYAVSYRRTHAADGSAVPLAQQPVSTIQQPGTYLVTIRVDDRNYVDDGNLDGTLGDASTRIVWVNDATDVAFTDGGATGALVGGTDTLTLELRGADGLVRAGPAATAVEVVSGGTQVVLADSASGTFAERANLTIAAFASSVDLFARAEALATEPVTLSATVSAPFGSLGGATTSFAPAANLVFAAGDGWSVDWQVGEAALSGPVIVALEGEGGVPVAAPSDLRVGLAASPEVSFRDDGGQLLLGAYVDVLAGRSSAVFRVVPGTVGTTMLAASHTPGFVAVASAERALTVTARPVVSSVNPQQLPRGTTSAPIMVSGAGFQSGAWSTSQVVFGGTGVTVESVAFVSAARLDLTVSVSADAPLGGRSLAVTNADGGTGSLDAVLTVLSNPQVSAVSPTSGTQGSTVRVIVSGSGFEGATLEFGSGVTVSDVSRTATQVVADVAIASGAMTGIRTATLRNVDGRTATFDFTVLVGLRTFQRGSGYVGQWVELQIVGNDLLGATLGSDGWTDHTVVDQSDTYVLVHAQIGSVGTTGITVTTDSGSVSGGEIRRVVLESQGTATIVGGSVATHVADVQLSEGVTYYFDIEGASTPNGSYTLSDPVFTLRSGGTQVAYDDDGGVGLNSQSTFVANATGVYSLWVQPFNSSSSSGTIRWSVSR